jgi:hypothetical protein
MTSALTLILGFAAFGAGATLLCFLLVGARRSPTFGLILAFIPTLAGLFVGGLLPGNSAGLTVGTVTIHPADIVAVVYLLVVAVRHLGARRRVGSIGLAAMAFLAILTSSFVRGVAEHDVFAAANQYRGHLYVAAAVLYFAGHPSVRLRQQQIASLWVIAAYALTVIALARWMAPLESVFGPLEASGPGGVGRPTDAATTFVILMGAYLAFHHRYRWWVPGGLLGAVVAFQHRTVWVAAIVGLAVLMFGSERRQLSRFAGASIIVVLGMSVVSPAVFDSLTEPLDQAARERGTYEWRVQGWTASLEDQLRTPGDWLTGRSMGTPWDRSLRGQTVTVSPHSLYVELLLRSGIVGLGAFLLIYGLLVRTSLLTNDKRLITLTLAIVASQLVYAIPYKPDLLQGALIGLSAALLASSRGSNADERPADLTRTASL